MLCSAFLQNKQSLLGLKVCVKENKYGIIRFYGKTSFTEGLWCGVELEEAIGDNDGVFNNIRYFTCKKNHGIFLPASEARIINLPDAENFECNLSSKPSSIKKFEENSVNTNVENPLSKFSGDLQPETENLHVSNTEISSRKNSLNKFTVLSGLNGEKHLSTIDEENSECDSLHIDSIKEISNVVNFYECESMVPKNLNETYSASELMDDQLNHQCTEENCDSDESLGILPDFIIDSAWNSWIFNENEPGGKDLNITVNLSNKSTKNIGEKGNFINEAKNEKSIAPICHEQNLSRSKNKIPALCNWKMESSSILPDFLIDSALNSWILNENEPGRDLNITVNLTNKSTENIGEDGTFINETKSEESFISPICHERNVSCAESPAFCNQKKESLSILNGFIMNSDLDSYTFDKNELGEGLNTTINLLDTNKEFLISPVSNKENTSCVVNNESPNFCNPKVPMYASTPKQENKYFNIADEGVCSNKNIFNESAEIMLNRTRTKIHEIDLESMMTNVPTSANKNIFNKFHLKKKMSEKCNESAEIMLNRTRTKIYEIDLESMMTNVPTSAHSKFSEDKNSEQNLLNVTCNIIKPQEEMLLNTTFKSLTILTDRSILPTIENDELNLINKENIPYHSPRIKSEHSDVPTHQKSKFYDTAALNITVCKENVLNETCILEKEFEANFHQTELVKDGSSKNTISNETNILNTTVLYPQELTKTEQICLKENISEYLNVAKNIKEDLLNTTYDKIDESCLQETDSKTLKCITNLDGNKELGNSQNKRVKMLSNAKITVDLKNEGMKDKHTFFDKNKAMRKSTGTFGRSDVPSTKFNQPIRRKSFTDTTISAVHQRKINEQSSGNSLLSKYSMGDNLNKNHLIKKERLVGGSSDLNTKVAKGFVLKSKESGKLNSRKSVNGVYVKSNQENILNETLNLPSYINDVGKTVIKKPRQSIEISKSAYGVCAKSCEENVLNETLNLSLHISDVGKTVIKKPKQSTENSTKSINAVYVKSGEGNVLNRTLDLSPPLGDIGKTVIKKPRRYAESYSKECPVDTCKKTLYKINKSSIPSLQNNSIKIPLVEKALTQKSIEDQACAFPTKMDLKKPDTLVEKRQISRLPQVGASKKNNFLIPPSNYKLPMNISRPQSAIPTGNHFIKSKIPSAPQYSQEGKSSLEIPRKTNSAIRKPFQNKSR